MSIKLLIGLFACIVNIAAIAQQGEKKTIRVVDSLSAQEKANRNPILLHTELDSLIKIYQQSLPVEIRKPDPVPAPQRSDHTAFLFIAILLLTALVILLVYDNRKISARSLKLLRKKLESEQAINELKPRKSKAVMTLENKIDDLTAEINRLHQENEGLNSVINEYNGVQHDYDALKHGMQKIYKVRNYPGNDQQKTEANSLQQVFATEDRVANYAYEKFLKPILAITDSNKNHPAKTSEENMQRLLDLLISLSLLYIEYLYLRVGELSIGGKMVERIQGLSVGNGVDPSLLRQLDMHHGSRALVLKMMLNKLNLPQLSYPVFDETNLNH